MERIVMMWIVLLAVGCAGPSNAVRDDADAPSAAPTAAAAPAAPTAAAATAATPAEPLSVVRREVSDRGATVATLSNGLTVIVQENHNVPVVTVQSIVRTGGMYEGPWLGCGLSHLLEHLVAKGATRGAGHAQASKESGSRLDAIGAQSNAFTSLDRTVYYINCAAGRTDEAIDILSDWMARPAITSGEFEREHGVVQRELEMGRDDTRRQMYYAHMANFYQTHPASVPVIGYADALKRVTYADVMAYHSQTYVPQRMIFVVVGAVKTDAVLDTICRSFAGFEAGRVPPAVLPEPPVLAGVRRVVQVSETVKDVSEEISFRTIPLVHEDLYALDVLSYILTNGPSSRLHRIVLRQKKLVTSVDSSSWTPQWGAGQFNISFKADPGDVESAEAEIFAELSRIAREPVTDDELAKAKRQKVADYVYSQQSVESQASTLGMDYMSSGDVEFSRRYTDRIQRVTAEQVVRVAQQYLTPDAMAITRMVPAAAAGAVTGGGVARRPDRIERFTLDNGLTVILNSTDSVDLVAMNLAVLGGVLTEDAATNGLGTLMTGLSVKGAGERSADEIADFFDRAGGAINAISGNNTFLWSAQVLKADAVEAAEILADVVMQPTYPESELEILRPRIVASIKRTDEKWSSQMQLNFRRKFFGPDAPYHLLPLGAVDVVEKADRDAIASHHKRWVKAGSAVLAIYGNFDFDTMRNMVAERFAVMPAGVNKLDIPPVRKVAADGERYELPTANTGAAIMIGWPGMLFAETADRDAMSVLDTIISGYQLPRGWLHTELRGKQLVYVVHAYNWVGQAPGAFVVYAMTQPAKADEVVGIILANVKRTLSHEFTATEVDEAVTMIVTADLLGNQTMASLASQAALDELYGVGYDYGKSLAKRLRAVTVADVKRVAKKYLAGPAVVTVTTPTAGAGP